MRVSVFLSLCVFVYCKSAVECGQLCRVFASSGSLPICGYLRVYQYDGMANKSDDDDDDVATHRR